MSVAALAINTKVFQRYPLSRHALAVSFDGFS
jgi:hypothetical protein